MRSAEIMLYHYFMANCESTISFPRIKRFTATLEELMGKEINASGLLRLLALGGLVEQHPTGQYQLGPSCIIYRAEFSLGVNLPLNTLQMLSPYLRTENGTGLHIYAHLPPLAIENISYRSFDFQAIAIRYTPFRKIIAQFLKDSEDGETNSTFWHYDPISNIFSPVNRFLTGNNLYRVHKFSQQHFSYLYESRSVSGAAQQFTFGRSDLETLLLVKTYLALGCSNAINYVLPREYLRTDPYRKLPLTLEKLLYLNHILITGHFPAEGEYRLSKVGFRIINKILNNKINIKNA